MKTIHKSVLLAHSAAEMFALVTDVARYPEFLPWCHEGAVLEQHEGGMLARVGMSMGGLRHSFTTRNRHEINAAVQMELVDGPFSQLLGSWQFLPLGDGSQRACKVEFRLSYAFSSVTLAAVVGPVFDKIAGSLVDAFVKRADQVYGGGKLMEPTLCITLCVVRAPRTVEEIELEVPSGCTVADVLQAQAPHLQGLGAGEPAVWGRRVEPSTELRQGDRLEWLGPLKVDPKTARRERFKGQGAKKAGLFASRRPASKPGY